MEMKEINQVSIDESNKILTSPAYMKGSATPYEVFTGIESLVSELYNRINKL